MAVYCEESWNSAGVSRLCAVFAKFFSGGESVEMHICQKNSFIKK